MRRVIAATKKQYEQNRQQIKQMIRFGIVGILNTAIGLGTVLLLQDVMGVNPYLANPIGYTLGLINSFIWNKLWTFKSKRDFQKELLPFITVFAVTFALQYGVFAFLFKHGLDQTLSQIAANICYTVTGFVGNRYYTFAKLEDEQQISDDNQ